ncbi:PREDICTED: aminoacyl tRNA [Prunus dulcis]|uniref:methionine--tRNA ligase n=1 Tax=Prunus dulcis TaxID=3755 RepID=A0A5E4GFR0_PRUDU|nr:PREDICTED: aminoacyl tRNA [Prunus dulcis]
MDIGDLTVTSKEEQMAAKLPIPGKRNILITSALPYVNNVPHPGNIIGCVLSANVFARYCRLRGYNTLYCDTCKRFLADRLVEGTCPTQGCDYASAQGDQCEYSGKILNPTKLKDPKCKSQNAIQGTNAWLKEGLKQRCITRDLKWGVLVPHDNFKDKKWWKNPENVELYQFMGKDNVPFHTVSDTLFTWADLQAKLNSELLNNLGNFINRVLSFVAKPSGQGYGSIIPDAPRAESDLLTEKLAEKVGKYVEQYIEAMEKVKLKQGLKTAMSISSEGNAYLQESQFWKLYKEDQPRCAFVIRTSVGLVYLLACLLEPFMPSFSLEVFKQLNLPPEKHISLCDDKGDIDRARRPWEIVPVGHKIAKPEPLFKELKDEEVESLRKKFAGSQADRKEREEAEAVKVAAQLKKMKVSDNSGKKKQQATKSAAEAEISISRLDIRVGLITKAQKHPDADSLYIQEIDVGEGQARTVVSGLVKYIPIEEMQNRKVCVLCNLKPATMRGIKSQAMVLAASNSDHSTVELVNPPKAAQVGERVTFPGFAGEPDEVLNPKKKVWESLQVDLHTNTDLVACYRDIPLTTSAGVCTVSSICGGSIR